MKIFPILFPSPLLLLCSFILLLRWIYGTHVHLTGPAAAAVKSEALAFGAFNLRTLIILFSHKGGAHKTWRKIQFHHWQASGGGGGAWPVSEGEGGRASPTRKHTIDEASEMKTFAHTHTRVIVRWCAQHSVFVQVVLHQIESNGVYFFASATNFWANRTWTTSSTAANLNFAPVVVCVCLLAFSHWVLPAAWVYARCGPHIGPTLWFVLCVCLCVCVFVVLPKLNGHWILFRWIYSYFSCSYSSANRL